MSIPCQGAVAPFGDDSRAEHEFAVHELCNGEKHDRTF